MVGEPLKSFNAANVKFIVAYGGHKAGISADGRAALTIKKG
jgi:hypothetical protein